MKKFLIFGILVLMVGQFVLAAKAQIAPTPTSKAEHKYDYQYD